MHVIYDVALATTQQYFSSRVMENCAQLNLSFFLVEPFWAADFLEKLCQDELGVRVLIDMASDAYQPGNLYFELAKQAKKSGSYVIDDPDRVAIFAHKGILHKKLVENGIDVPETIIVQRSELEGFRITEEMKQYLGVPFVVKPGWGGGRWGVILNATSEEDLMRSAQEADYSDSFLLQKKIIPQDVDGRIGWFRMLHIFGEIIPCWWDPRVGLYQLVTPLQYRTYRLSPLVKITREIARISGIGFFSTEITLSSDGRFLPIDYLNTECDMHAKSFWPSGVPDEVVRHIATSLVTHASSIARKGRGPFDDELIQRDEDWDMRRRKGLILPGEGALF
jgi:hypothetical protein